MFTPIHLNDQATQSLLAATIGSLVIPLPPALLADPHRPVDWESVTEVIIRELTSTFQSMRNLDDAGSHIDALHALATIALEIRAGNWTITLNGCIKSPLLDSTAYDTMSLDSLLTLAQQQLSTLNKTQGAINARLIDRFDRQSLLHKAMYPLPIPTTECAPVPVFLNTSYSTSAKVS